MELHWSVDYRSHQEHFDYERCFSEAFRQAAGVRYPQKYSRCRKKYRILPNYWDGFSTHKEGYEGAGTVELEEVWDGRRWEVTGIQDNTDSAERIRFHYFRGNGLESRFTSVIENLHRDEYRMLELEGSVTDGSLRVDTPKGLPVVRERWLSDPVYTNWCLLGRIPEENFVLLENLESCYPDMRRKELGAWEFAGICLKGYVLSGYGTPFSYYWVNGQGHVMIASQTLMTYVLYEAEFEGGEAAWTADPISFY